MSFNKHWQPTPYDLAWTQNLIDHLNDGGIWGVPRNNSVWKLDKQKRMFTCIFGKEDALFQAITICCRKLGYSTELKREKLAPETVAQHMAASTQFTEFGTGKSISRVGKNPYL